MAATSATRPETKLKAAAVRGSLKLAIIEWAPVEYAEVIAPPGGMKAQSRRNCGPLTEGKLRSAVELRSSHAAAAMARGSQPVQMEA